MRLEEQEKIIKAIQSGDFKARDHFFEKIYEEHYSGLKNWILTKKGVEHEDVKILFHDALIVLDKKIRTEEFNANRPVRPYLMKIIEYNRRNFLRSKIRQSKLNDKKSPEPQMMEPPPDYLLITEEERVIFQEKLSLLSGKCKRALKLYGLNTSMKGIAEELDIKEQSAKNLVARCREKLRVLLK